MNIPEQVVASEAASAERPRRKRHVLVVDDSRLQRKLVMKYLSRWDYRITEAASGEEACKLCENDLPDIVVSDWMMPGMNGLEFCDAFRRLSGEQYGYFILLTSKSEKDEVARGLDAGADDFVSKPVDAHELRARITAGERILDMQRELSEKNRLISETLAELQRLYDSIDSDLIEAKKLQQSLIPNRRQTFEGGTLSLLLRQSGHVGGDLVGFFPAGEGMLGMYSIDVSGHGISSALMTARLAGYLSATAPDQNVALARGADGKYRSRAPKDVVADLNELVLGEMETEHYFTMLLAVLDLETGHLVMSQAGHPHPVIQRADGRIEQHGEGGFPVGLISGLEYSEFEDRLLPGDRLLILSDGVVECPDPDDNLLGEDGLAELMSDLASMTDQTFFEALMWRLSEFAGEKDFPDDISGLLFER